MMVSIDKLTEQGFRLTNPRRELLKVLSSSPLSVKEMYDLLQKKQIHIDLASVYRTLELFVELGMVYALELGEGMKRYELVNEKHHHHLICNNCKRIEDVEMAEENFDKKMNKKSKFKINHHHLEFFGLCVSCQ